LSYYVRTPEAEEIAKRFKEIQQPKAVPVPPTETGFVKPGGWGGNRDPRTWKPTKMKDDPKLWKVVDNKGKNIVTSFTTQEFAQRVIDIARELYQEDGDPDEPDTTPDVPPTQPEPPTTGQLGPYAAVGPTLQPTRRPEKGYTTRHYRSGKPDDRTVEMNVKGIKARNHQFITYVTINSIEHDDNTSLKLGGTHMGTGWFDNGVSFKDGQVCLGTEKKHPSTQTCVKKGPKIGSILGKRVGVACSYFADQNKVEIFTDLGTGWKKQLEGTDVGGFNPKADTFECQLRIDGFEDLPDIHTAVVQEIAA
jgi:hypothetical protein